MCSSYKHETIYLNRVSVLKHILEKINFNFFVMFLGHTKLSISVFKYILLNLSKICLKYIFFNWAFSFMLTCSFNCLLLYQYIWRNVDKRTTFQWHLIVLQDLKKGRVTIVISYFLTECGLIVLEEREMMFHFEEEEMEAYSPWLNFHIY